MFRKIGKTLLLAIGLSLFVSVCAFAMEIEGTWNKTTDGKWTYQQADEEDITRNKLVEIEGKTYGFDKDGYLITGFATIDGKGYYFEKSGNKEPGVSKYGTLVKESWKEVETGKYYYFDKNGIWVKSKTGFQKISGKIYYLNTTGKVAIGSKKINGKYFYFGAKGVLVTGPKKLDGKLYLYSASGSLGVKGARITSSGWKTVSGKKYYVGSKGVLKTGWYREKGKRYYLKKSTGACLVGWHYIGKYKYYFNSKGVLVQDVSSKIGKQSSYYVTVNRRTCVVTIYAKDGKKGYTIPVKAMACSVGNPRTRTPVGTFHTIQKYRWKVLMGPSYGQYATRITRGILFHSVAGKKRSVYNVDYREYNKLGSPASHGCVRLCVRDAKWIYDNCKIGMTVKITDKCDQPLDKPKTIKISKSTHYDPTDPAIKRK